MSINEIIVKLAEKLRQLGADYQSSGRDVYKAEWKEACGFCFIEENGKIICEFKWLANADYNEKKGVTKENYEVIIKALVKVCNKKYGKSYPEKNSCSGRQTGMRIRIAEMKNFDDDTSRNLFVNKICEWEKAEIQSNKFMEVFERIRNDNDKVKIVNKLLDEILKKI